jgi:hypothetical protein
MSHRSKPLGKTDTIPNFTLVMGPSGSGKTMFCLECLPLMVFPEASNMKEIFRVHLRAFTLLEDYDETKPKLDLPTLLGNHIQNVVRGWLPDYRYTTRTVLPIDLFLFVVIDEAGSRRYKSFFESDAEILKLVTALHKMNYKFMKGVHVTVTGTGIETLTKSIDSKVATKKYHMKPWLSTHFHAMLANMKRKDDEDMVKRIVKRFPILENLTTNARCAYYLVDTMPILTYVRKERWADYVAASVANVAQSYISSNGLGDVITIASGNLIVAKEVFNALNEAMENPSKPIFPTFDHIKNAKICSVTQSLLDINVEVGKEGTVFTSEGCMFSVSMTPAIAVVLAEILCEKSVVCWDLQGLEATLALGEWKHMITALDVSEFTSASGIIRMRSPIPAARANVRFTLPLVDKATVILNGPGAPYASVMAPFRLVRAKFSSIAHKGLVVNFAAEMGKMGLTNDPAYRLQQAVTSALYLMWSELGSSAGVSNLFVKFAKLGGDEQEGEEEDDEGDEDDEEEEDDDEDYVDDEGKDDVDNKDDDVGEEARCEHYPYQALVSNRTPAHKMASFRLEHGNPYVLPGDKATKPMKKTQIKVCEEFSTVVTAVFVTNAKRLVFRTKKPAAKSKAKQFAITEEQSTDEEKRPAVDELKPEKTAKQQQLPVNESQQQERARKRKQDADEQQQPGHQQKHSIRERKQAACKRKNEKDSSFSIGRKDVDWQGVLKKKKLPDYLICDLRQNVEVRFLFY